MKNLIRTVCAVGLLFITMAGCGHGEKEVTPTITIQPDGLREQRPGLNVIKMIEGFPIGISIEKGELYVRAEIRPGGKYLIHIVSLDDFSINRDIELTAGDFQSPVEYFSPSHIQWLDNRYYIIDQFEKIVVYDRNFKHLYSSMYNHLRYFVDLFTHEDEIHFVIGSKTYPPRGSGSPGVSYSVDWYVLPGNKKPVHEKNISGKGRILSAFSLKKTGNNDYYVGYFWPVLSGFEKNGVIYYAAGKRACIYSYDLKTGKRETIGLAFLKPKTYTDGQARKIGYYNTDGWEKKYKKKSGGNVVYRAYPGEIHHFGIYDAGNNKIGIAGGINLEKMIYRLDIIDSARWRYVKSIWLPMGYSFQKSMTGNFRGLVKAFIDVDRGLYVYSDIVGEDFDYMVNISRFDGQ